MRRLLLQCLRQRTEDSVWSRLGWTALEIPLDTYQGINA